jgi:hypothetical protein
MRLTSNDEETEPELGWGNTGPQTRLAAGYELGNVRESDGNADDEPSYGADALELDPCDLGEPEEYLGW